MPKKIKIKAFTRYAEKGASSRVRLYQFIPILKEKNCDITPAPFFNNKYLETLYNKKKRPILSVLMAYLYRVFYLLTTFKYDIIWIEKELFPFLPFWFEKIFLLGKKRIIIDYDDAVFHRYKTQKFAHLMRFATCVNCANKYLADYAKKAGAKKINILPNSIILSDYFPKKKEEKETFTIGWVGTPITAPYLKLIEKQLQYAEKEFNANFIFIGVKNHGLNLKNVEIVPWDIKTVGKNISRFDVGIMPLPDEPFERGKSGYKLLQYFASSLPVVASNIGANNEIVDNEINGFLCKTSEDWIKAFETLHCNPELRYKMGKQGYEKVLKLYNAVYGDLWNTLLYS